MEKWCATALHIAFHGIIDPGQPGWDHPLSCSSERLQQIIFALRKRGYRLVTCDEYAQSYQSEEKLATLTFDDGYRNNLKAIQLLESLGVVGTLFPIVCTLRGELPPNRRLTLAIERVGTITVRDWLLEYFDDTVYCQMIADPEWLAPGPFQNDKNMLTKRIKTVWNCHLPLRQLRLASDNLKREFLAEVDELEMCRQTFLDLDELRHASELGMEIGSHTTTHTLLENQNRIDCYQEIRESVRTLATSLSQKVSSLCLPYGGREIASHVVDAAQRNEVSLWNYCERHLPKSSLANEKYPAFHRIDHQLFDLKTIT